MTKQKRVALYLRVSTNNGHQTVENQQLELEAIAKRSGLADRRHLYRP
jgi:hypothetical protein